MRVNVRCFARARDLAGRDQIILELPEGATVADVRAGLAAACPALSGILERSALALHEEFADNDMLVPRDAEIALLPPVSGGEEKTMIYLTRDPIDVQQITAAVLRPDCGAVVTFLGTVRDVTEGRVTTALDYEAYAAMAEKKMAEIERETRGRWPVGAMMMVHRLGHLEVGEASVAVAVSSPHRAQAFEACRYAIDRLKELVPIWKKENWADGTCEWIHPAQAAGASRSEAD
jgi:molybdopterin synthase catalytic subunit